MVTNYLLIILDIFSQYKPSPQWSVTRPAYCLCTSHPLFSAPSDTAHTTLPTAPCHPLPTLPSDFRACMLPSLHTTARSSSLSPLPPLMWSFSPGGREERRWEGRKIMLVCWMARFGELPYAFHNTLASVLHDQIFFSPSTYCPSLSQCYLPLSKVLSKCSWKQKSLNNIQLNQLDLQLQAWRNGECWLVRAVWQGTGRWYLKGQLQLFPYPGLFSALFHLLVSLPKCFKHMITCIVSSIAMDIKGKKYILVGFLSSVPVVHKHKVSPKVEENHRAQHSDKWCHV